MSTSDIYTLSLHDALPIFLYRFRTFPENRLVRHVGPATGRAGTGSGARARNRALQEKARPENAGRSEEHTSELQSHSDLVCRLLLEKKKKQCYKQLTLS